jgi:ABC-type glycerol-3-phosphate transport system substrate-binding protein
MPRRGALLLLVLAAALGAAGCGGGSKTYSAAKTRACLVKSGRVVTNPPASDLVASAAEGGSFAVHFGTNTAIVSFGTDRDGAERIVRAYQRFRGKNIGLLDVLHAYGNAVVLWAIHPLDDHVNAIEDCLL